MAAADETHMKGDKMDSEEAKPIPGFPFADLRAVIQRGTTQVPAATENSGSEK